MPLNLYMGSLQLGQADRLQMETARESAFQIVELLRDVPPFSCLKYEIVHSYVDAVFTEDYLQNTMDFAKSGNLAGAVSLEYQKALTLLRVLPVMAHLGFSLAEFKRELLPFAEKLHESVRTPDGYAASFGQYFSADPDLSAENPGWMSLANASVQYAAATIPGKEKSQLVKRMHYVSFVGMFRSDLFEGLCVGHAGMSGKLRPAQGRGVPYIRPSRDWKRSDPMPDDGGRRFLFILGRIQAGAWYCMALQ